MKTDTIEVSNTIDIIPRHEPSNPLNFTDEELSLINYRLKLAIPLYPDLPVGTLKQAVEYDLLNTKTKQNQTENETKNENEN